MNQANARRRLFDVLTELLDLARQRGYARVSLETDSSPPFDAAIAMYRRFGFVECGPFADYREGAFSRFMTLALITRWVKSRVRWKNLK